jgi:hypothetical protein
MPLIYFLVPALKPLRVVRVISWIAYWLRAGNYPRNHTNKHKAKSGNDQAPLDNIKSYRLCWLSNTRDLRKVDGT